MSLMVERGIRGGIYHSIYRYAKVDSKQMKDYQIFIYSVLRCK